jgi:hypothetical protein
LIGHHPSIANTAATATAPGLFPELPRSCDLSSWLATNQQADGKNNIIANASAALPFGHPNRMTHPSGATPNSTTTAQCGIQTRMYGFALYPNVPSHSPDAARTVYLNVRAPSFLASPRQIVDSSDVALIDRSPTVTVHASDIHRLRIQRTSTININPRQMKQNTLNALRTGTFYRQRLPFIPPYFCFNCAISPSISTFLFLMLNRCVGSRMSSNARLLKAPRWALSFARNKPN